MSLTEAPFPEKKNCPEEGTVCDIMLFRHKSVDIGISKPEQVS